VSDWANATGTIWLDYGTAATTTGIVWNYVGGYGQTPTKKRREQMTLFKVYLLDVRKGEVTSEHTLVGRDKGDAGLGLALNAREQKLKRRDELEILWSTVGEFEKLKIERVTIEKDEEETTT